MSEGHKTIGDCVSRYLREEGKALVTQVHRTHCTHFTHCTRCTVYTLYTLYMLYTLYTLYNSIQATDEQSQQTNAVTYIQNLLELKDRFDSFLQQSFGNDKFFKQVIVAIINTSINSVPYLLVSM